MPGRGATAGVVLLSVATLACGKNPTGAEARATAATTQGSLALSDTAPSGTPTGLRVVDFHAHFDPRWPELILQRLDQAGISTSVNFSGGSPRLVDASVRAQEQSQGRLRFFCVIPWGGSDRIPDFVGEVVRFLRECKAAGGLGVKISKGLGLAALDPWTGGLLRVDDPWLDPIFEEAGRLGLPVAMHTGDPQAFFRSCGPENERYEELTLAPEWCFADRTIYPSWEDLFGAFVSRVARHPGTTFVGAHFGNAPEEPLRVARTMREHSNLWIDTAARVPEIGRRPDETRAVFSEFPERILFGTDIQIGPEMTVLGAGPPDTTPADFERFFRSTWRFFETADEGIESPTPIQGRWTIHGIALGRDALEKFYHANAERLLGL
jgi:predicted TIM-barrel fold metal-dependent hydrolase